MSATTTLHRDGSINKGFVGDEGHAYEGIDPSDIDARLKVNGRGVDQRDGGGRAAPARRPQNLNIPSASPKVFKKVQRQRPESTQSHQYEELPFNKDKRNLELKKMDRGNVYHPNPPPVGNIPSVSERISADSSRYPPSEFGSDVTMLRDGPRKQENPLYDNVKPAKEMSSSRSNIVLWVLVIILFLLVLTLFVLNILLLSGTIKLNNEAVNKGVQALPLAENNDVKIGALQKKVDSLELSGGVPVTISNRISALETSVSQLTTDMTSLGSKVTSLERTLNSRLNNLQIVSNNLKVSIDELTLDFYAANTSLSNQITDLQNLFSTQESNLPCIRTTVSNTQAGITFVDTPLVPTSPTKFYSQYVILSPTCSSIGAKTMTVKEYKIDDMPAYKKYGCSCEVSDTASKIKCQLNYFMCKV